ncbi:hypothetical protein Clacol_009559 [Clathrus columnatus]|uniref:Uncharacterized protein n=1 Tax=Clathrus columnatus TaxID=1419009 RepID=A0AAV5ARG8_9AGAM|nr:hypothetical protein Clacol_009559 [Clathrus columnatus]
MLIDFNIAKPPSADPPTTYDPTKEKRHVMGTTGWASLNFHSGTDLGPGDNLESLAYTSTRKYSAEYTFRGWIIVYKAKAAVSGSQLPWTRLPPNHQIPNYDALGGRVFRFGESLGGYLKDDPLDWAPVPPVKAEQSSFDGEHDSIDYNESIGDNDSKAHKQLSCW